MTKLKQIFENYPDNEFKVADGYDDAVIGVAFDKATGCDRLVYSVTKIIELIMTGDNIDYDTAKEHFEFNIKDAYMGKLTPLWFDDELLEFE